MNEIMNENIDESVNVMTDNVNNNFLKVVVDELFDDQAMVDIGCSGSLVDNNFCKKHNLHVIPLQFGESISYGAASDTGITVVGSTYIVLTFAGEKFSHNFK